MTEAPSAAPVATKKASKMPLIAGAAVLCLALGGGAGWFMHHRAATAAAAAASAGDPAPAAPGSDVKSVMHLESFVVNVQGASDGGYLRVSIDLGLGTEQKEGEGAPAPPTGRIRDTILSVLDTRTVEDLATPAGKDKLKQDMLKAINDRLPELQCKEVYFTDFLVQH